MASGDTINNYSKMKPIGKYIVVALANDETKTDSGLILSANDVSEFRYQRGVVVEPGTEVMDIKKGDKIYFDKSHSFTMLISNGQYTILQERDVVVVE
jgi:co-chaperonin GroES (HSP10)